MTDKDFSKEKEIGQILHYLTATFNQVTSRLDRPFRSSTKGANQAYYLQREFAYLLNEVKQGPRCVLQKNISACNEFLDTLVQELGQTTEAESVQA